MEQKRVTKYNIQQITRKDMTPGELIEFMKQGAIYRDFSQILKEIYPSEHLQEALVAGLFAATGEERDSIARKVRKWLGGESLPQNREQLFQICFALKLGEGEANLLLGSAAETGIHYRNPRELVYTYCLRREKTYQEALKLLQPMMEIYEKAQLRRDGNLGETQRPLCYTSQIRRAFSYVETEEELEAFFRTNSFSLGTIHETAYQKFMELLNCLKQPEPDGEVYSMEHVMEQYLRMSIPNTKHTGSLTYLQRAVKKNWPSESTLLRMEKRRQDVSRKVLLLLFIVTEDFEISRTNEEKEKRAKILERGGYIEDFDDMEDLMEEDADTRLEVRLTRINLFLDSYGMNRLDQGNPFDCLILYALKAGYDEAGDEPLSMNLQRALDVLFEYSPME